VEIVGLLAAAAQDAETDAPRASALSSDSSTRAAAPSAMTKPSRSLENGFDAFSGGSFCVDSADSSEKRISASAVAEPSAPIERPVAFAAADRLDAELDGGGAGGAGGGQRDRQAARAEFFGQPVRDGAELGGFEDVEFLQHGRGLRDALRGGVALAVAVEAEAVGASPVRPAARQETAVRRNRRG
jgi:hypothetical protein